MYALFAGQTYEPNGGWADHRKTSHEVETLRVEAVAQVGDGADWWHIVNLLTGEVVDRWMTDIYTNVGDPLAHYDPAGHGLGSIEHGRPAPAQTDAFLDSGAKD